MPVLDRPLAAGDRVALVDDDDNAALALSWVVAEAGYEPVLIPPHRGGPEDLVAAISQQAVAAICDHRLGQKRSISYYGAEIVARSNGSRIPAILITSYANSDENTTIREWRSGIPQLLNRGAETSNPEIVSEALAIADAERRGIFTLHREAYRTVVRVDETRSSPSGLITEVVVTAWRPQQTVSIPTTMISKAINGLRRPENGQRFMADVNIYAESPGELFFSNFSPAPHIPKEWMP